MICHGNKDNKNENGKGKSHVSHFLMMALCCGAPVLILFLVPFLIKNGGSGIAGILSVIAPFICPIMMLFMIPMMFKGNKDKAKHSCCDDKPAQLEEKVQD